MTFHVKAPRNRALGRLKQGTMNRTEAAYAQHLELRKAAGDGGVAWYAFEGVKLRLADNTFYTPDFAVMLSRGDLEMHECKSGYWEDDAKVKIKVAAKLFPFRFVAAYALPKRDGGGWRFEEY